MNSPQPWRALDALAGGGVAAEWARELGNEFARFHPLLQLSTGTAKTYPCTNRFACECHHRLEPGRRGGWVAVCDCGGCAPIRLNDGDVLVHEPDIGKLAAAMARACRWTIRTTETAVRGVWEVAAWGEPRVPVLLRIGADEERLRRDVEDLINAGLGPFLLLTPTGASVSPRIEAMLKRPGCLGVAMADMFALEPNGALRLIGSLTALRRELEARAATRHDAGTLLRTLHKKMDAVTADHRELRDAQEPVEESVARQVWAIVTKLDAEEIRREPSAIRVFRLYCQREMTMDRIADKCGCGKGTVVNRLKLIRKATGMKPEQLKRLSPHVAKMEEQMTDSRAEHIHRKSHLNAPDDDEDERN